MPPFQPTPLDFSQIKANLKDYLRAQAEFEDYDFEGSGLAVLIDILAANTMHNAFYLNMVANEMFLDSAILRKDVVSRAKALGYTPTSRRSARAFITATIIPGTSPSSITIPEGTRFKTVIDNKSYTFRTYTTHVITPVSGQYVIRDMEIIEGDRLTHRYTVDNDRYTPRSLFLIPNEGCDTSLLTIKIQTSATDSTVEVYKLANDIGEITGDSKVYFLQEADNLNYEIY
mgnify:FL=1